MSINIISATDDNYHLLTMMASMKNPDRGMKYWCYAFADLFGKDLQQSLTGPRAFRIPPTIYGVLKRFLLQNHNSIKFGYIT